MRDPYEVLGVGRSADAAAIKSAFRKLAKKLHPDANKNEPKSAQRFAEVNTAYEILGEDAKRKAFDRGEIDAEGKPRFSGFEGFRPGAGSGGGRGSPDIDMEHFSFGTGGFRQTGKGRGAAFDNIEDVLSSVLGGMGARGQGRAGFRGGFQPESFDTGSDVSVETTITLAEAAQGGARRVHLPTGKEVEVKIPPGLADGRQIRLKGQGLPGAGGVGDALITIRIAPHPFFTVDGADLKVEVPITLYEAVLGGKVRVPTLEGAVELNMPAGTSGGRTFRVRGKGMTADGRKGDLYATVQIVLPENGDSALDKLMREWRDTRPYDPRRDLK